ncbi:hypothetical protein [Oceanobacillus halotolerans]|uniref:hypothetical protein n=1 Tax=Oceanobacillus halotolerans TaxID=2663380 RepID=UPI001CF7DC27|nr:hypothetical protein [Oceanobacillus halotolerans]
MAGKGDFFRRTNIKSIKAVPKVKYETNHPAILMDAKVQYSYADEPIRLVGFEGEEKNSID